MSKKSMAAAKEEKEQAEATVTCGDCDTKNPAGTVYCTACGNEL